MDSGRIKVSVIIPVYNSEEYLKTCVGSVLVQTLKEIQVVVVDDGSTDRSWGIIQEFAKKDDRVVAFKQKNSGVSVARNNGLRLAKGEYIGFVDSDDFVDKGYFENLYAAAVSKEADIATGYVDMDDERRRHFYNYTLKQAVRENKCSLVGVVWMNLYRKAMLDANDVWFPENLKTAEDNPFNLMASYFANKVVRADDDSVMYHQTSRDGSLTARQYDKTSLLPMGQAILETTKLLNGLPNYSKDIYISRILDTIGYFYHRFALVDDVDPYTRYRIAITFIRIWRQLKYVNEIRKQIKGRDIDLNKMSYGLIVSYFYDRYVLRPQENNKKKETGKVVMQYVKTIPKKVIKSLLPHGIVSLYKRRQVAPGLGAPDEKKIAVVGAYKENKYTSLIKDSIKEAGYRPSDFAGGAKFVWLHWFENGIHDYDDFVRKVSLVGVWKRQGKKIIVNVHNKKPHESTVPSTSHALMTSLLDSADLVSIMNDETKDVLRDIWYYGDDFSRVVTVPHPNYINAYGEKIPPTKLNNNVLRVLFFGQVRPYKGVERLIEATKNLKNIEIGIYGVPKDDDYVAKLKRLCSDRENITFRLERIPDEDIPQIFSDYHIVALPYSIESSLNSGAAILALSYARTVVGTNNGTLKQLGDNSLYFGYDYKDDKDHAKKLKQSIKLIHERYQGRYNDLLKIGERAYDSVNKHNSIEVVARYIDEMIKRVD